MNKTVKIVTFVPPEDADKLRQALGEAGAGVIGEYSFCSFSVIGKGRFLPSVNSNPHIGTRENFEIVEEERVEVVCKRADARQIVKIMKENHPYEEVAFDVYPLISEDEL